MPTFRLVTPTNMVNVQVEDKAVLLRALTREEVEWHWVGDVVCIWPKGVDDKALGSVAKKVAEAVIPEITHGYSNDPHHAVIDKNEEALRRRRAMDGSLVEAVISLCNERKVLRVSPAQIWKEKVSHAGIFGSKTTMTAHLLMLSSQPGTGIRRLGHGGYGKEPATEPGGESDDEADPAWMPDEERPVVELPDLSNEELADRFDDEGLIELSMRYLRSIMPVYLNDSYTETRDVYPTFSVVR